MMAPFNFTHERNGLTFSYIQFIASVLRVKLEDVTKKSVKCFFNVWIVPAAATEEEQGPDWVEVMVDILLSLLSQPSRHIRQVCKTVFTSICPHVTPAALTAILDVSNTHKVFYRQMVKVMSADQWRLTSLVVMEMALLLSCHWQLCVWLCFWGFV